MTSSKSSPKHDAKVSYKSVTAFDMYYQLTYMSAMASAGISRSKTFELAALSKCSAAQYFEAVNTLVDEFRYDYPDACRIIGVKGASENIRTFLLRLSDALRSGEPLGDFLADMAEFSDGSRYLNFPGFQEGKDDFIRKAFGSQYERLAALKGKYDPDNLFSLNQNVKPE